MATPNQSLLDEPTVEPIPPRFWWLKRIGAGVVLYLLVLVAARLWWGHFAENRLQAQIDKYHAAGQPTAIEDFAIPFVPDEENGAYYLREAMKKFVQPPGMSKEEYQAALDSTWWPQNAAAVRQVVAANAESLALIRTARSKETADWGYRLTSPLLGMLLPRLGEQRQLARLALAAALDQHARGDDAEAVESLRDIFGVSRHMQTMEPFRVVYLTQMAVDAVGAASVQRVLHDLSIANGAAGSSTCVTPVRREQLLALIDDLQNDELVLSAWQRDWYGERLMILDTVRIMTSTSNPFAAVLGFGFAAVPWPVATVFGPAWKLEVIPRMQRLTALAYAGSVPDYFLARGLVQDQLPEAQSAVSLAANFGSMLFPEHGDLQFSHHFRCLAARRLAAVAVALRLYEVEQGHRPVSLDELVPAYLKDIPRDPFDPNEGVMRYLPDGPSPMVYSVGDNGIDDGGTYGCYDDGAVNDRTLDLPFFLAQDRPRAAPPPLPSPRKPSR